MLLKIFSAAVVIAFIAAYDVRQPAKLSPRLVKAVADQPAEVLCIDNTVAPPVFR